MGYYIECNKPHGKAKEIIDNLEGVEISVSEAEMIIREDIGGAVICVVNNGPFEAAAYCYNLNEFRAFSRPEDNRPKTWLLVSNEDKVKELTGYNRQ